MKKTNISKFIAVAVDLEMKGFIKEAIIRKILNFDIKRF